MKFRGEEISRIEGAPSVLWGKEAFIEDWRKNLADFGVIEVKTEDVERLAVIYSEYEDLFQMIGNDLNLSQEQKDSMLMHLNHALGHVAEIGIREIKDILLSIQDQKYGNSLRTYADYFDPIIDMFLKKVVEVY